jgi:hypothetical protein
MDMWDKLDTDFACVSEFNIVQCKCLMTRIEALESPRTVITGQSRVSLVLELGIDIQSCIRSTGRRKKNGYLDVCVCICVYI